MDIEPEEGTYRIARSSMETDSATVHRYGMGLYNEHGFLFTPAGIAHFHRQVLQIYRSMRRTMELSALYALINSRDREFTYELQHGRFSTDDWLDFAREQATDYGSCQKSAKSLIQRVTNAINTLNSRGFKANTIIAPHTGGKYFVGTGSEMTDYNIAGPDGPRRTFQNPEKVKSFMGLPVFHTKPYIDGAKRNPIDPFIRTRMHGEFYKMYGLRADKIDPINYRTSQRDIKIYCWKADDEVTLSFRSLIMNHFAWDKTDKDGNTWLKGMGVKMTHAGFVADDVDLQHMQKPLSPARETDMGDLFGYYQGKKYYFARTIGEMQKDFVPMDLIERMARCMKSREVNPFVLKTQKSIDLSTTTLTGMYPPAVYDSRNRVLVAAADKFLFLGENVPKPLTAAALPDLVGKRSPEARRLIYINAFPVNHLLNDKLLPVDVTRSWVKITPTTKGNLVRLSDLLITSFNVKDVGGNENIKDYFDKLKTIATVDGESLFKKMTVFCDLTTLLSFDGEIASTAAPPLFPPYYVLTEEEFNFIKELFPTLLASLVAKHDEAPAVFETPLAGFTDSLDEVRGTPEVKEAPAQRLGVPVLSTKQTAAFHVENNNLGLSSYPEIVNVLKKDYANKTSGFVHAVNIGSKAFKTSDEISKSSFGQQLDDLQSLIKEAPSRETRPKIEHALDMFSKNYIPQQQNEGPVATPTSSAGGVVTASTSDVLNRRPIENSQRHSGKN